jgi:hypothetical protein
MYVAERLKFPIPTMVNGRWMRWLWALVDKNKNKIQGL